MFNSSAKIIAAFCVTVFFDYFYVHLVMMKEYKIMKQKSNSSDGVQ